MKRFQKMAFCLMAAGALASCSNNDDDNSTSGSLEAKWTPIKTVFKVGGVSTPYNYDENEPGCDKDYIQFVAGGIVKDASYYKNTANVCTEQSDNAGQWVRTNNTLTINGSENYDGSYTIQKATGSELELKTTESISGTSAEVVVYLQKVN